MTVDWRHRRSIRLRDYDYTSSGAYFVTICAYQKQMVFEDATLKQIIEQTWAGLPDRFPTIQLDAFVIMPNHVHFIVLLSVAPRAGALTAHRPEQTPRSRAGESPAPKTDNDPAGVVGAPLAGALTAHRPEQTPSSRAGASPAPTSLGDVVGAFKSIVSVEWLRWVKTNAPGVSGRVWQRNYYERVIRNDSELNRIRQYIQDNPLNWHLDHDNPDYQTDAKHDQDWAWLEAQSVQR